MYNLSFLIIYKVIVRLIKFSWLNLTIIYKKKKLFGEVEEMTLDIEDICIDLVNDNKKFDDEIEFF